MKVKVNPVESIRSWYLRGTRYDEVLNCGKRIRVQKKTGMEGVCVINLGEYVGNRGSELLQIFLYTCMGD